MYYPDTGQVASLLTARDHFAMAALVGLLARASLPGSPRKVAELAYDFGLAMETESLKRQVMQKESPE